MTRLPGAVSHARRIATGQPFGGCLGASRRGSGGLGRSRKSCSLRHACQPTKARRAQRQALRGRTTNSATPAATSTCGLRPTQRAPSTAQSAALKTGASPAANWPKSLRRCSLASCSRCFLNASSSAAAFTSVRRSRLPTMHPGLCAVPPGWRKTASNRNAPGSSPAPD